MCFLFIAIALQGCATDSAKQIKAFSEATVLTSANLSKAFQTVQDNHRDEEVSSILSQLDRTRGFDPSKLKPFLTTNALQVRLSVVDGLSTYAANLSILVGNSALTNLDIETTKLSQTLTNFDTNVVKEAYTSKTPFTPQQLQIFTAAINAIGHWIIE